MNPLVLFVGSPLYLLYLRALGAKVGRGVVIFSRSVPVCTDLLTIGDGTVISQTSLLSCYRAHGGMLQPGAVTIGKDVFVGEATVIDIETSMGDGAQLGHTSSLHAGQAVPDGERWHGSPAQRTDVDYRAVDPRDCGTLRRAVYTGVQLLNVLFLVLPLGFGGLSLLLVEVPQLAALLDSGPLALTGWTFYRDALIASLALFIGSMLVGFLILVTVPRVLNLVIRPDKVYRLYGFHYGAHRAIARITNLKFFTTLFGDSSSIVGYLRCLGYDLSRVEQTGSNFGTQVKHDNPVPVLHRQRNDGRRRAVAPQRRFLEHVLPRVPSVDRGTQLPREPHRLPAQGRTGDNCLLATKVMVPIDGQVRENVGLLGSPSFEIPRSVERDSRFDHLKSGDELRRGLAAKNRHNAVTMGLFLLVRWIHLFGVTLLASVAAELYSTFGASAIALANRPRPPFHGRLLRAVRTCRDTGSGPCSR